ncbi:MAG: restriction endonuclease subunit S, partial [Christensenellaceae bacterium]
HYSVIAPFFYESIKSEAGGTATPIINKSKWSSLLFPVPPFQEQQRIVAKVDELMAMCDELEAAESELEAMEEHFIEYLPKSILQMAVQGKLVPQDLHDEPASELLERIHAEKAKLIKEGKIKKEKPLPPITDDEIPYDLPEGWIWCRLGDIHSIHRGITFPAAAKYKEAEQGLICCATTGSVQAKYNPNADVFVPAQYIKNEGQWLQTNDIIMSTANSRELVGKTCIWEGAEPKTFGGFLTVIRAVSKLLPAYSYYTIQYLWKSGAFTSSATQTTNIANINNNILNETLFPLPPLAEQQRIVAKADELLDLCDELKTTKSAPVKKSETDSNIVSLPQVIEQEEEIGIAARGDATQPYSPKLQDTISKLLGDESCE